MGGGAVCVRCRAYLNFTVHELVQARIISLGFAYRLRCVVFLSKPTRANRTRRTYALALKPVARVERTTTAVPAPCSYYYWARESSTMISDRSFRDRAVLMRDKWFSSPRNVSSRHCCTRRSRSTEECTRVEKQEFRRRRGGKKPTKLNCITFNIIITCTCTTTATPSVPPRRDKFITIRNVTTNLRAKNATVHVIL